MADEKLKLPYIRTIGTIKDFIYGGQTVSTTKITSFIKALDSIASVENLFTKRKYFNPGDSQLLSPVKKEVLEQGTSINPRFFNNHLFPSDLLRALTELSIIFSKKNNNFKKYESNLILVKKWGQFNKTITIKGRSTQLRSEINETTLIDHFQEIQELLTKIMNAYKLNEDLASINEDTTSKQQDLDSSSKYTKNDDNEPNADSNQESQEDLTPPPEVTPQQRIENAKANVKNLRNEQITPQQRIKNAQKNVTDLKNEQKEILDKKVKAVKYESAWLYNRAIYEMFTSYGIKKSDIDSQLLSTLNSSIYEFTLGMANSVSGQKDLSLMFGSASKRQEALLRFYSKFGSENSTQINNYYQKLKASPAFKNLSGKQRENFKSFHSSLISNEALTIEPEKALQNSLENILNSDSPVLNKNIQNTLDAMILQYGYDEANKDNPDTIDVINAMDSQKLALIFGIPQEIAKNIDDPNELEKLRTTLINYTEQRASYLYLKTNELSSSKGLLNLTRKELKKLKEGDEKTLSKHQTFIAISRDAIKKNEVETVAGGLETNKNRKKDKLAKIEKQYKTFIPIWNSLSAKEQRIVYKKFNIAFDKNANKDTKLIFIPEFLVFDVSTLKTFKNIDNNKNIKAKNKKTYQEFLKESEEYLAEIGQQIIAEEEYGRFLRDSYIYYLNNQSFQEDQTLLLADYLSNGQKLEKYPDGAFFDNYSASELMQASENLQAENWQLSNENNNLANPRGLPKRITNNKHYKSLRSKLSKYFKKTDPKKAMAQAMKKTAASAALKGVAAASNLLLPGLGAAIYAMGKKIGAKKTVAIIGSALAMLIGKTLYALTTLGGLVGGIVGGVVGFIIGGPAGIIPGVVVGANVGQAINSTSLFGSTAAAHTIGENAAAQQAAATATAANIAAQQAAEQATAQATAAQAAATTFLGFPIAIMAPGGAMALAIAMTLYTVFLIQSAFLTSLPNDRIEVNFNNDGVNCSSDVLKLPFDRPNNDNAARAYDIVNNLEQGFWCYWNKSPDFPELFNNQEFERYPYHCYINNHTPRGCEGDPIDISGANSMFWCTQLINKTYNHVFNTSSQVMHLEFSNTPGYEYFPIEGKTYADIRIGDALFSGTEARDWNIGHVAIVIDVNEDYIITVDANSSTKSHRFTVSSLGTIQNLSTLRVIGFGRKLY